MTQPNEIAAFVEACGRALAVEGTVEEFGVFRILAYVVRGRHVRIGTNGSFYWVAADLSCEIPSDVGIMWAPGDTYKRAKLFELDEGPPKTGDSAFDEVYVVVGVGSAGATFAPRLPSAVRQALLEFADVRPDIGWLTAQLQRRLHVQSEPPLCRDNRVPGFSALGSELFTPVHAAAAADRTVALAERIESSR